MVRTLRQHLTRDTDGLDSLVVRRDPDVDSPVDKARDGERRWRAPSCRHARA